MRLEWLPVLLGVVIGLVGVGLIADAWMEDGVVVGKDRRRRPRRERDRAGEGTAGAGVISLGIALIGRDWRFGTLAILLGAVLFIVGAYRNRAFLKDAILFRGAARRSQTPAAAAAPEEPPRKVRIR